MELQSLGTFRLVRPLVTRSASFRLYLARHEDDPEAGAPSYVVKLLLPGRSPDHAHLAAQFDHEIKLLQAFNHPGIPSVHGDGEKDGVRYLVMDYVDGCDLAALLGHESGNPRAVSREVAVFIMGQLADALHHIHTFEVLDDSTNKFVELGVVHRDLCPSNILLSRTGSVLLADYNSASSSWLPRPHDMSQAGTKAYMAPERIVGTAPASVQSDLFGMAVVLWEMIKGQRCFKADDDLKTMDAIVKFDISHSSRRLAGLSAKLGDIVRKNLDRDPARRYSSAYQMLQRLAQTPEAAAAERAQSELATLVREVSHGRNGPAAAATAIFRFNIGMLWVLAGSCAAGVACRRRCVRRSKRSSAPSLPPAQTWARPRRDVETRRTSPRDEVSSAAPSPIAAPLAGSNIASRDCSMRTPGWSLLRTVFTWQACAELQSQPLTVATDFTQDTQTALALSNSRATALAAALGSHCHERSSITLSAVRSTRSRPRRTLFASPVVLSVMPSTM